MTEQTSNKPYPIGHYIKIMLAILLTALVLDVVISFFAIYIVKKQSSSYLEDTADLYIDRINHDFAYMNHFMGWTLVNDESVKTMAESEIDSTPFLKSNETLYKRFTELRKNYGQQYSFFIYLKEQNFFSNSSPMNLTYPAYLELKQQIQAYAEQNTVHQYADWTPILIRDQYYIINIVPFYDRYFVGLISAEDLIQPLRQINLGENGYVSLVDNHNNRLVSPGSESDADPRYQPRSDVSKPFSNASISVNMVIQFGKFEKIMIAQMLIMLLLVIVTFTLSAVMMYFNKRVLKPIQSFAKNLSLIIEDDRSMDFKSSKIFELEQANKYFKQLVEQLRSFKIDIYEREMEKQRIQLDYMKLQINPHFFLNCLTTIYSMAQMQMYDGIEKMTISTSRYFRYIFQQGHDFVSLKDEIEHVRVYLQIQQHRYQHSLTYEIQLAEDVGEMRIPPLILQTFIENAVKYAVSRVNEARIALSVNRLHVNGEDTAAIIISDNGPGFPEPILAALQAGEPLSQATGMHIGIMNTIQRLELLYPQQTNIIFDNQDSGGACVALYIPYVAQDGRASQ